MTLLAVDVRNSLTTLGVFKGDDLIAHWRVSSTDGRTADEWQVVIGGLIGASQLLELDGISISCTVPSILAEMRELIGRYYADVAVSIVEPGTKTGVPIMTDNPREVGADRIVNSLAAATLYGGPAIVVDFGTATTFDVVDPAGRYLGGAISPGIEISLEALARRGAQLRAVELVPPRSVIAKNTVEAMQSGIIYGFAGQVDGIVGRMMDELGGDPRVIATGNLAPIVIDECSTITDHEPWLTLIGLRLVHERNH
ncbi:type III pantothenate kinase [soil metagenome]